jgi:hypothetical protein
MKSRQAMRWTYGLMLVLVILTPITWMLTGTSFAQSTDNREFTSEFFLNRCTWSSKGRNLYMVLEPGAKLVLEGQEEGEKVHLVIIVRNETKVISVPGIGPVETRLVEEVETVDGELSEVSRNYFAMCVETSSIFYFGEDVDFYENGKIVNHEGSWRAGANGAKPGLQMPGIILLGSRYFQEVAPKVALDRAEIVSMTEVVDTPAGRFRRCLKTEETTPLEPGVKEFKFYAPGIGLVRDGSLRLVQASGF